MFNKVTPAKSQSQIYFRQLLYFLPMTYELFQTLQHIAIILLAG